MDPQSFNMILYQQENERWKVDVEFCRDEIKVLNRYLQEVIEKNAVSGMKNEITQFQYELSEKIEISYELIDAIAIHDDTLRPGIPGEEDREAAHTLLRNRVAEFCNSYSSFKSLFVRFLARADIIV